MEKTYDITALGELLIDFAERGISEQGNQILEVCPGGAPCNMLAMASKLGKKTAFIGKIGTGIHGSMLRETIKEAGIDDRGLVGDSSVHTTLAFVHTLAGGEREFSFHRDPGADMMLRADELDEELIRSSKVFHFGTLSMTDEPVISATKKALEIAKDAGCIISFDPNLRELLWSDLEDAKEAMKFGFGYCDILKIADNEIQFVTGMEDYDEGIKYLLDTYNIPLIFLTLGSNGSRAYYKGMKVEVSGYTVDTIETTGAGDTFCGSTVSKVLEKGIDSLDEESLTEILDFANAAAAIVTTKRGAIRSMPCIEDVEALRNM